MKKYVTAILLAFACHDTYAQSGLLGIWPQAGGNITIEPTGDSIQAGGLEFVAEPGILTQGESPAPFAFFIPNLAYPGNVTLGSLGAPVWIDGPIELDVAVAAFAGCGDVTATWGKGVVPTAFPMWAGCPEPTSFSLAAFGLVGILGLRARRSPHT